MTNNNKTKAKIKTTNVSIPIPIKLLGFLLKKGQYIVPNNIADQYAHVCFKLYKSHKLVPIWMSNIQQVHKD